MLTSAKSLADRLSLENSAAASIQFPKARMWASALLCSARLACHAPATRRC